MGGAGSPGRSQSVSFERLAGVYDATRGGLERGEAFAREIAGWVVGPRILEVGVGTGAVALPLGRIAGSPVVGVDLSPAMASLAAERLPGRVAVADADHLPVAAGAVDAVVIVWVLQLVPDIARTLAEMARVLRPGGHLAVVLSRPEQVPDEIQVIVREMFERLGPRAPDGRHQVADLAGENGFAVRAAGLTAEHYWDESPLDVADLLEKRTFASLLDLSAERFEEVVGPAIRELRALSQPEAARRRAARYHYVYCERMAGEA